MKRRVFVELDHGKIVRIIRGWPAFLAGTFIEEERSKAIAEIRKQVFDRANGQCEYCGAAITYQTGHMHEKIFRSRGGEISLTNCVALCYNCHSKEHHLGKGAS